MFLADKNAYLTRSLIQDVKAWWRGESATLSEAYKKLRHIRVKLAVRPILFIDLLSSEPYFPGAVLRGTC